MSSEQALAEKKNPTRQQVTLVEAKEAGAEIGVDWPSARFDVGDLRAGIMHELEHADVTGGDLGDTARIAYAHLKTCPDYYERLEAVEKGCELEVIGPAPEKINPVPSKKPLSAAQYARKMAKEGKFANMRPSAGPGSGQFYIEDDDFHLLSDGPFKTRDHAMSCISKAHDKAAKIRAENKNPSAVRPIGHQWLALKDVLALEPYAAAQGVSSVARSRKGFVRAYERAGGKILNMEEFWPNKREGFIKRHRAQVLNSGEQEW